MRNTTEAVKLSFVCFAFFTVFNTSVFAAEWVYTVMPSNSGVIAHLPTPIDKPEVGDLNGTPFFQHTSSNFTTRYHFYTNDLVTNLWNGVMVHWSDWNKRDLQSVGTFVFAVTGTPSQIKVEFEDTAYNKTIFKLNDVTNSLAPYYHIPVSMISNPANIRVISFVADDQLAGTGNTSGWFTVTTAGLKFDWRPERVLDGIPSELPGNPTAQVVGGGNPDTVLINTNSSMIQIQYVVDILGWSGCTLHFETPQDFSSWTNLILGLGGTPAHVKVEVIDDDNRTMIGTCQSVNDNPPLNYFIFPISTLTNDSTRIRDINFVVDMDLAGPGNETGLLHIATGGGLNYQIEVGPSGTGPFSTLPDLPSLVEVGGAATGTVITMVSTSQFTVAYNVTNGWSGVTLLYDDYGTPPFEYADLSGFSAFTFGITGLPSTLSFEIEDTNGCKATARLLSTAGGNWQYFTIPTATLTNKGVNLSKTRFLNLVVDAALAGVDHEIGSFGVQIGGIHPGPGTIGASTGAISRLPPNTMGVLSCVQVIGGGTNTDIRQLSAGLTHVDYDIENGGYAGTTINFDDYGTGPIESTDLSTYSQLVFRIRGEPAQIKCEFEDIHTNQYVDTLLFVSSAWQYYTVPTSNLANGGLDLSAIRFINFVVDQNLAGDGHYAGSFEFEILGLYFELNLAGLPGLIPSVLTNGPFSEAVGGGNPDTLLIKTNSSRIEVAYNIAGGGWSGASMVYDDRSTSETNESQDLTIYSSNLVFGLVGEPSAMKVEFLDADNSKFIATFGGIASSALYYRVDTALLTNDATRISAISFVVDQNLAGVGHYTGTVVILTGGLQYELWVAGEAYESPTQLPLTVNATGPSAVILGGANPDTLLEQLSTNQIHLAYNVTTGGFSGASILYDDYSTVATNESGDFSAWTDLVFGLIGYPADLKFEFEDALGVKYAGRFTGLTPAWQSFRIPLSVLTEHGLNLHRICSLNFVVDQALAGIGNHSNSFDILTAGLLFPNLSIAVRDNDNDGLSDLWEDRHGINSYDDGRVDIDNGSAGDPDGDGCDNYTEYLAGTDPRNAGSSPDLRMSRVSADTMRMTLSGINQRRYQFQRATNLHAGLWENIGSSTQLTSDILLQIDDPQTNACFYRCRIEGAEESYMPGLPGVIVVGGGDANTRLAQTSTRDFEFEYNVSGGGYAGATINFDDYGTIPIEYADLSGYSEFRFSIAGSSRHVKYEFLDTSDNRIVGAFQYLSENFQDYLVSRQWLTDQGIDAAHIRSISFIVDEQHAGANMSGSVRIRSWGLSPLLQLQPAADTSATMLPSAPIPPLTIDIGGGNHAGNWTQSGLTNILLHYDVSGGGYDGVTIAYDDFSTPEFTESANFSSFTSVVFGVYGEPASVKIEFKDANGAMAAGKLCGLTNSVQYFNVPADGLTDCGVSLTNVAFISFVVDYYLAGSGHTTGAVQIVTDGLRMP